MIEHIPSRFLQNRGCACSVYEKAPDFATVRNLRGFGASLKKMNSLFSAKEVGFSDDWTSRLKS